MQPTKRQKKLLNFIKDFIEKNGYSPSYREIMNGLGYKSLGTVSQHINALIERELIRKKYNYGRTLEIVGSDEKLLEERVLKVYKRASTKDKQIIVKALDVLGFTSLTKRLK